MTKRGLDILTDAERREKVYRNPPTTSYRAHRYGIVYRTPDKSVEEVFLLEDSFENLRATWSCLPLSEDVHVIQVYLVKPDHPDGGTFVANHL